MYKYVFVCVCRYMDMNVEAREHLTVLFLKRLYMSFKAGSLTGLELTDIPSGTPGIHLFPPPHVG